jgi:acyl-CoA reductase-like NAD-dependent aldehyde dehydrogenase
MNSLNQQFDVQPSEDTQAKLEETGSVSSQVAKLFDNQKQAFAKQSNPTLEQRKQSLKSLDRVIRDNISNIQAAISQDFGHRSGDETLISEVMGSLKAITYARKNLKSWIKPRKKAVDITFKPATAKIVPQPLGVVGIMSPWNFPFGLVIKPLVAAIAAGNRVMIKPSELTPAVAQLLSDLLGQVFEDTEVCVVQGGVDVATAFTELPFDHLLFTGSTANGRRVMSAAAKNLTPVTLELGGKSPVFIDNSTNLKTASKAIVTGKLLNSGQTCTAPDYILVPSSRQAEFVEVFTETARSMYSDPINNPDFTSIVNDSHYARLQSYLDNASESGAEIVSLYPEANSDSSARKLLPTLVLNPTPESTIMNEEIFGPLLIVVAYDQLEDAVEFVKSKPHPLALYIFTEDKKVEDYVLENTIAGGVTINDTLLHYTQESLPVGGVGASGFGAYHGVAGFETFSHMKPVFRQSRINSVDLLRAPYTGKSKWLLKNIIRIS